MSDTGSANPDKARIWPLESVRGLAALSVAVWHFLELFAYRAMQDASGPVADAVRYSPLRLLADGGFAVRTFFVLSGFVLSLGFLHAGRDTVAVRAAAARRFPRLALPAWGSILVSYGLMAGGLYGHHAVIAECPWLDTQRAQLDYQFRPGPRTVATEAATVFFRGTPAENDYNRALWTMQVELKGSLLVFAVLALFGAARQPLAAYLVVGGVLFGLGEMYCVDFVAGMVLAELLSDGGPGWIKSTVRRAGFFLCTAGWLLAAIPPDRFYATTGLFRVSNILPTVAAVMLIAGVLGSPLLARFLSWAPLTWLGRVSFALYLLHLPVIFSAGMWAFLIAYRMTTSYLTALAAASLATVGVLAVASHAYYRWVDRPAISIARAASRYFR